MKFYLSVFFVLIISLQISSQEKVLKGIVKSSNDGVPLPGVSVVIKGKSQGVSTDFDGEYQIEAKANDVLVFSYIGYVTEYRTVGTSSTINVFLDEDFSALEEVIVVGYGYQNNAAVRTYKPSAAQIKRNKQKAYQNKLASQIQSNNVVNAFQGEISGVNVGHQVNNPKTTSQNKIRGLATVSSKNNPLVVIDGVISSYKNIEKLDPNNVKAIDVLKGASSAAIYRSRGRNGVILISTKKNTTSVDKEPLYIVDGAPIKKENNHIIENLAEGDIDNLTTNFFSRKGVKRYCEIFK